MIIYEEILEFFHLVTRNSLAFLFFLSLLSLFSPFECILQNGHQMFISMFKSTLRYIFFASSFTYHMSVTLSVGVQFCKHCVYVGLPCACVCVYASGVFVTFFCKSCKTANIHLLYKVSCFSPAITFGFHSFLHPVFPTVLLCFHCCHADCRIYTVDVS